MKQLTMLLFTLFAAVILTAQPLTYRGMNPQPAEVKLAELKYFEPGDQILSAYHFEGELHASWIQPANPGRFFIRVMGDDEKPVKTGISDKETPVYLLFRNGKLFSLIMEPLGRVSAWDAFRLHATQEQVYVNDNLYYYLCPEWPNVDEITIDTRLSVTAMPFYKWLPYNQFLPSFYASIDIELVTGSGMIMPSRTLNFYRYWFRTADFERGYIELRVKVTPLANCESDNLTRIIKINL